MNTTWNLSEEHDATPELQELADSVRQHLEEKAGNKFKSYKLVKYSEINMSYGIMFVLKIEVGKNDYIHSLVEQWEASLGGQTTGFYVQKGKKLEDPLLQTLHDYHNSKTQAQPEEGKNE